MVIDGRTVGKAMAISLISDAFSALAVDFAAVDRDGALRALARIELAIADALTDFSLQNPEGARPYSEAFDAMLDTISTLVENARNAVQTGRNPTK